MNQVFIYDKEHFDAIYNGDKLYEAVPYKTNQSIEDQDVIVIQEEFTGYFFTAIVTRVQYYNDIDTVFSVHSSELLKERKEYEEYDDGYLVFKITRISDI